jgi:hypothetical protein
MMGKYVRKTESVNAFKFTRASNLKEIEAFLGGDYDVLVETPRSLSGVSRLHLFTKHPNGAYWVYEGEWCVLSDCGGVSVYTDAAFKLNFKESADED